MIDRDELRRRHARERAAHCYGLTLTTADVMAIEADIAAKKTVRRMVQGDGREQHMAAVGGTVALVVYDPAAKIVVTFLPPGSRLLPSHFSRKRTAR